MIAKTERPTYTDLLGEGPVMNNYRSQTHESHDFVTWFYIKYWNSIIFLYQEMAQHFPVTYCVSVSILSLRTQYWGV